MRSSPSTWPIGASHFQFLFSAPENAPLSDARLPLGGRLARLQRSAQRAKPHCECRYFAGMTEQEAAAALDVSVNSVQRLWRVAKSACEWRSVEGANV